MKKNILINLMIIAWLVTACAQALQPAAADPDQPISATPGENSGGDKMAQLWEPQPSDINLHKGDVIIEEQELLVLESFPPQFRLHLSGTLPTPCHQLRVKVNPPTNDRAIEVEAYSLSKLDEICIQVLEPFEVTVPIQDLPAGKFAVTVNGLRVGEIAVP